MTVIVVTNAIVLLDRVKQNEQKMIIRDALVEATATRMRPIFMTAIATICAMLPLLVKQAETGEFSLTKSRYCSYWWISHGNPTHSDCNSTYILIALF